MNKNFFKNLRAELKRDYGVTRNSVDFVPFEDWRKKLKSYPLEFQEEYQRTVETLKRNLGLSDLSSKRNLDKKLILFSGLPGAGKTTLARMIAEKISGTILLRGHDIVDSLQLYGPKKRTYQSRLRSRGFDHPDPWYLSYLYQETLTGDLLDLGYNVVFDDHIRTRVNRVGYYHFARGHKARAIFVQVETPFSASWERRKGEMELNFLSRFVFQSQDFSESEIKKYDKVVSVDGTLGLNNIERRLVRGIKSG